MKIKFLILGLLCCVIVNAQKFGDTSSFVLKGHITNLKNQYFEYSVSGFFGSKRSSIIVDSSGRFSKRITIENKQQDLFIVLNNNPASFTVKNNDTIDIECDANNFTNTFKIHTPNKERQNALDIQFIGCKEFLMKNYELQKRLYQDKSLNDSAKFELVNSLFNEELKLIVDSARYRNFYLLFPITYFRYSQLLFSHRLIPRFQLIADTSYIKDEAELMFIKYTAYSELSEALFWTNSSYRDFIYNYSRFFFPYKSFSGTGEGQDNFNPTLDDYYFAKGKIVIIPIRKWVITKIILDDYGNFKFGDVTNVKNMFQQDLGDSDLYLKQLLEDKCTAMTTLKKGEPAPGFTLKNEQGKNVSLSDFKGKAVYLDFWGVGCGPCIYDIDNYEKKLHEQYKGKNVVFVSICVDSNEPEWIAGMKKHNMNDGINLIAEGWTNNPVCKAYNVTGIPHYVLIDKEGKMYDNNAPRMYELRNKPGGNEIDELLSK